MYRAHARRKRTSLALATASLVLWCSGVLLTDRGLAALGSENARTSANQPAEQPDDSTSDLARLVNEAFALRESTIVTLQIDTKPGATQNIVVPIDGKEHTVELSPCSVRAEDYQVLIESPDGTVTPLEPSPVRTVRGTVLEVADSVVAGAVQEDGLHLLIRLTAEDTYWLQPVGTRVDDASAGAHVLYRQDDVIPSGSWCGNDATAVNEQVNQDNGSRQAMGSEVCYVAELGTDADQEFLDIWGSPEAVEDRINFIINTVSIQYESYVEISHVITAVLIHTNPPTLPEDIYPYTSTDAGTLLNQFRNHWLKNHDDIPYDLAQLFTGKHLQGGFSFQGSVCTPNGFALARTECCESDGCTTDLVAHALGHLWNAFHCDPCSTTMRSFLGCFNIFGPTSISSIIAYRDSLTCLDSPGDDTTTPGDLNGDGSVGAADLAILLAAWGPCADCTDCRADLNGDCTVGPADLAILLANWG